MLKKILIVLAVLLVVAGLLGTRDWDAPELGQRLLDAAGDATGARLQAEGFRFNLLKGVILENVQATAEQEGRSVNASLDRLVLEHRLGPLLSGTVAIEQVLLERPQIEIVEWATEGTGAGEAPAEEPTGEPSPETPPEKRGGGLAIDVKQVRVEDGELSMKRRDEEGETRVQGLDFEMRNLRYQPGPRSFATLAAEGDLEIATLGSNHVELRDLKSRFQLADARFEMPELTLTTDFGDFESHAEVDFNPTPYTYRFSGRGPAIDLNRAIGATSGLGPASLELDVTGEGADPEAVQATGVAALSEGTFPDASVFRQIDSALGKNVVVGGAYEPTEARFALDNGVVTVSPFAFEAERLRMAVQGTADLDGPLDFDLAVATDREGIQIEGVGSNVLDVLSDDAGWVPVPIHVSGTIEEPRVRPDASALLAQAGSGLKREAKEAATEAATDALKGLLNRKKKP